jgi:hypothetical protein
MGHQTGISANVHPPAAPFAASHVLQSSGDLRAVRNLGRQHLHPGVYPPRFQYLAKFTLARIRVQRKPMNQNAIPHPASPQEAQAAANGYNSVVPFRQITAGRREIPAAATWIFSGAVER